MIQPKLPIDEYENRVMKIRYIQVFLTHLQLFSVVHYSFLKKLFLSNILLKELPTSPLLPKTNNFIIKPILML